MKNAILIIALISAIGFIATSCNKKEAKQAETSAPVVAGVQYTCPMHPEVLTEAPGTCPKCGMDLVKKENAAPADSTMDADTTMRM